MTYDQERSINVGDLERWASTIGGGLLAMYALRRSMGGLFLMALGGYFVFRGMTGHCPVYQATGVDTSQANLRRLAGRLPLPHGRGIQVEKSITINKTPADVYRFWRDLENLPRFMEHLESVRQSGDRQSHWVAKAPIGAEWNAEITEERENELIAWHSLEGSAVNTEGRVRFVQAPDGRGTEVFVTLTYSPPGGPVGTAAASLIKAVTAQQIKEDLRRFKEVMEAGEVATVKGQPSGRAETAGDGSARTPGYPRQRRGRVDVVEEASEESFPASDAPGWIKRTD